MRVGSASECTPTSGSAPHLTFSGSTQVISSGVTMRDNRIDSRTDSRRAHWTPAPATPRCRHHPGLPDMRPAADRFQHHLRPFKHHTSAGTPGAYPEALWGRLAASPSGRACSGAPGMPCSKHHNMMPSTTTHVLLWLLRNACTNCHRISAEALQQSGGSNGCEGC